MSNDLEEMDPLSPEYEAIMEAKQDAEDAEREGQTETPEEEQADTEAKSAVVEAKQEPADLTATPEKVIGVASKDGSRVLPYAALQAERRTARAERGARERAEQKLAEAEQLIEDMKSGKAAAQSADDLTEAEIDELAAQSPALAKVAKAARAAQAELAQLKAQTKAAPEAEEYADDPVQEAIDQVPMLSEWQATDPEKFTRAVELDAVMKTSPKWRDKPMEARFAHVARQVADEYDIQIADIPSTTKVPPNKANPKAVIDRVQRAAPNTLSDFKGGAVEQTTERIENMSALKARDRMSEMTDAEIDAHLAKFG